MSTVHFSTGIRAGKTNAKTFLETWGPSKTGRRGWQLLVAEAQCYVDDIVNGVGEQQVAHFYLGRLTALSKALHALRRQRKKLSWWRQHHAAVHKLQQQCEHLLPQLVLLQAAGY